MELDHEAILRTFAEEAAEHLDALETGLLALETRPGDPQLMQSIFRRAHTLKGSAACVGLDAISAFAHALEEALERMRSGQAGPSRELCTLLLNAVDGLRQMLPVALEGGEASCPAQGALAAFLSTAALPAAASPASAAPAAPANPTAPVAASAPAPGELQRALRVGADKLDRMLDLTGEIAVARGRLAAMLEAPERFGPGDLRDAHHDADRLYLELQEMVMRARLVPLGPLLRQHARTVRDLALSGGKQARLVVEDGEVELDTAVVDGVRDPLLHLIRNAVDHGLEPPQERLARGKDPVGTVALRARHEAGRVVVSVGDDGRGLDRERIAARARALGLAEAPERLDDEALSRLIFEPGFSTAAAVSETSGRGVGLDVVRRNVEALRGAVRVDSRPGEGAEIALELPLTLAIIEGFSVKVGEDAYVLPLEAVVECVELPASEHGHARDRGVIPLRGAPLPYLRLRRFFALGEAAPGARESVVVVRHGERLAGLAVDGLLGAGQFVIKPLARLFQGAPGVAGSALLGSGRVALIVDVPALLERALDRGLADELPAAPAPAPQNAAPFTEDR